MDKKEIFSKSLLANILDIDDNFCASKFTETNGIVQYNHPNGFPPPSPFTCWKLPSDDDILPDNEN